MAQLNKLLFLSAVSLMVPSHSLWSKDIVFKRDTKTAITIGAGIKINSSTKTSLHFPVNIDGVQGQISQSSQLSFKANDKQEKQTVVIQTPLTKFHNLAGGRVDNFFKITNDNIDLVSFTCLGDSAIAVQSFSGTFAMAQKQAELEEGINKIMGALYNLTTSDVFATGIAAQIMRGEEPTSSSAPSVLFGTISQVSSSQVNAQKAKASYLDTQRVDAGYSVFLPSVFIQELQNKLTSAELEYLFSIPARKVKTPDIFFGSVILLDSNWTKKEGFNTIRATPLGCSPMFKSALNQFYLDNSVETRQGQLTATYDKSTGKIWLKKIL